MRNGCLCLGELGMDWLMRGGDSVGCYGEDGICEGVGSGGLLEGA